MSDMQDMHPNKDQSKLPEQLQRLNKDLRDAAVTLSDEEARYLVDAYYIMQDDRKRAHNQVRSAELEPHSIIAWLGTNSAMLENQIKIALDRYSNASPVGQWMKAVYGIGPVIAAGLLAHIDIAQAPTVGHIWRFAGLDPSVKWEKGTKRPWNAQLKTLCWKIGQSFMKFSGKDECYYGKLYRERKAMEIARNERGENAERAAAILKEKSFKPQTEAFKWLKGYYPLGVTLRMSEIVGENEHETAQLRAEFLRDNKLSESEARYGRLPPAQIDARARRWAVKLFLAHLHGIWFRHQFGEDPPLPYPIAILGHAHIIGPSNRASEPQSLREP